MSQPTPPPADPPIRIEIKSPQELEEVLVKILK